MLSTLIPLVKDKLGDICASKNYRSIAMSSLVLKILDWVIVLLYGSKLELDGLQFAYLPKCSTNMCTWVAVEYIEYFLRNSTNMESIEYFLRNSTNMCTWVAVESIEYFLRNSTNMCTWMAVESIEYFLRNYVYKYVYMDGAVESIEYFLYKYVYMDGCEVYCILP